MSLVSFIGPRPNLLAVNPDASAEPPMRLEVQQPILTPENMEKLRHAELFSGGAFRSIELDICYPAAWGANGMEAALASLAAHAEDAIHQGYNILILSDRSVSAGDAADPRAARDGRGARASGEAGLAHVDRARRRDRLGARSAPLRAPRGLRRGSDPSRTSRSRRSRSLHEQIAEIDPKESQKRFIKAICKGLYKVMSKMGISTYQSYCGAQIFEAVGLQKAFVDKYFTGTVEQHRGHRTVRGRRGSRAAAHARLRRRSALSQRARRRRRVRVPDPRRRAHVDAGLDRQAAARGAREQPLDLPRVRGADQRAVARR